MKRKFRRLRDRDIDAMVELGGDEAVVVWDSLARGLRLRVGKHRNTWSLVREHRRRGARSATVRRLGFWPALSVAGARKAAQAITGQIAGGHLEPGKAAALLFTDAWDKYLAYLKAEKSPTWHKIATGLGKLYLIPKWQGWSLAEISNSPQDVKDWHADTAKHSAVIADKCGKLLRACYRYSGRLRRDLPAALPTSGIKFRDVEARQAGMTDAEHRAWGEAWRKITNKTRAAYQLAAILTGMRPGELARVRVEDVHDDHFVIRKAKAGADIWVPASAPIKAALQMALDAGQGSEWLFPGRNGGHIKKFDVDDLPCHGNALRHNYKNISVTMQPPVDETLQELLQAHTPKGVSRKYVAIMVVTQSAAMRAAQQRISERIVSLLGIKL